MNQNQLLNDVISYFKNFSQLTLGEQLAWGAIILGIIFIVAGLLIF